MLRSWKKVRKIVKWDTESKDYPNHLTLQQAIGLACRENEDRRRQFNPTLTVLRRSGINTIEDGAITQNNGNTWVRQLRDFGSFPEEEMVVKMHEIEELTEGEEQAASCLLDLKGWRWHEGNQEMQWGVELRVWIQHIYKRKQFNEELNMRWRIGTTQEEWTRRWQRLWGAKMSYRKKIWLRKVIQRDIFTRSREAEIGVSEGPCDRCPGRSEDLEHVIWNCRVLTQRKAGLVRIGALAGDGETLMQWIDSCLEQANRDTAKLNLLTSFTEVKVGATYQSQPTLGKNPPGREAPTLRTAVAVEHPAQTPIALAPSPRAMS
ncbi:hypothetical protein R1sor_012695 [Riccia sorocarpa]|uniref:Reverse transcriptase zinc-binding domain-containing protein n=1 Tax=Riccia sorocarpa TaxID=122646 RepID=A0ABD3I6E6_9MARC